MCGSAGSGTDLAEKATRAATTPSHRAGSTTPSSQRTGFATADEAESWAQEQINAARADDAEGESDVQFSRSGAKERLLAPNGKPSNLNEHQWRQVRTEPFKQWFGDWEALEQRRFLDGKPIATLRGDEFVPDGVPLTKKVPAWYQANYGGGVDVPGVGRVLLDKRAVKDSLAHGIRRDKSAAFAAVPQVLTKGMRLSDEPLRDAPSGRMLTFGAPISMGGQDYIVVVMVRTDPNANRMYVHEVALREKLQGSAFKTGARADAEMRTGAGPGAIRSLIHKIYAVKPDTVSKVVDANGEPLVVYHGTAADFSSFQPSDYEGGIYFTASPRYATDRARIAAQRDDGAASLMPVYLSIKNPVLAPRLDPARRLCCLPPHPLLARWWVLFRSSLIIIS